jgi:hypothetical protein
MVRMKLSWAAKTQYGLQAVREHTGKSASGAILPRIFVANPALSLAQHGNRTVGHNCPFVPASEALHHTKSSPVRVMSPASSHRRLTKMTGSLILMQQPAHFAPSDISKRFHLMKRVVSFCLTLFICTCLLLATERQARAYVDPGTGLLALQSLASMMAATAYFLRKRILGLFSKKKPSSGVVLPVAVRKDLS